MSDIDPEQIRREAKFLAEGRVGPTQQVAGYCLMLLDQVEGLGREADRLRGLVDADTDALDRSLAEAEQQILALTGSLEIAEGRLREVPRLVEMLQEAITNLAAWERQ